MLLSLSPLALRRWPSVMLGTGGGRAPTRHVAAARRALAPLSCCSRFIVGCSFMAIVDAVTHGYSRRVAERVGAE